MLSTDVSHALSILSAIYHTERVFVFNSSDNSAHVLSSVKAGSDDASKYLQSLCFDTLCKFLEAEAPNEQASQSSNSADLRLAQNTSYENNHLFTYKHALIETAQLQDSGADMATSFKLSISAVYDDKAIVKHKPHVVVGGLLDTQFATPNDAATRATHSLLAMLSKPAMMQQAKSQSSDIPTDLYEEIANLNDDFIYVKDKAGKLIFANQAVLSLFDRGAKTDALISTLRNTNSNNKVDEDHILTIFEKEIELLTADISASLNSKGMYEIEHCIDMPDGRQRLLDTVIRKFDTVNYSDCLLYMSRDITEREVLIKDLKRSNHDLDSFAYVASHDLKAPLNVIKRLVSWVMEDCATILPKDSMEDLSLVMNRANRMEQLLKDLLEYSRIGKDYHQAKTINVKSKVVELLALIDLPMGFSVKCDDVDISVPEVPFGIVLLNLIANAIKHHDSSNAKIQIKVRKNRTLNVVTIIDNGPGIDEENRSRIFELFETLKPRDEVEGSGMGLSVVKRLVEQYGGSIKVEGNRPRGTKFIVHWPLINMAEQVLTQIGTVKTKK